MGLFFRNTAVLDSFRNDKHFAWTKRNDTIANLNKNAAAENKEKIICIDVLVLYKLASDFDQYYVYHFCNIRRRHAGQLTDLCASGLAKFGRSKFQRQRKPSFLGLGGQRHGNDRAGSCVENIVTQDEHWTKP